VKFYHGGIPGLRPGDRVLPPSTTGKPTVLDFARETAPCGPQREDRVYLATEVEHARVFAAAYPYGGVYEVDPVGFVAPDPDATGPGYSWQAGEAVVVLVLKHGNRKKAVRARRKLRR